MTFPSILRFTGIAVAGAGLVLASCSSTGSTQNAPEALPATHAEILGEDADGAPQQGGVLNFAGYSLPGSLDPAQTQATGLTGATEMAAVYGQLVRFDDQAEAYVPEMAESIHESKDRTSWTLTLPGGATFSDGTPLDADAVIASIDRYNDHHGANSQQFQMTVESMEATDAHTVVFHLNSPWREFPALLTFGHGMIVAPASYAEETFVPVGAGAFTVESFTPGEELVVVARTDHWSAQPHLDKVVFSSIPGDQARLETLDAGGVDIVFLRGMEQILEAKESFGGYIFPTGMTDVLIINNRDGRPGEIDQVRQAIGYALDPDHFIERARYGFGSPGKAAFQSWSEWSTDTEPLGVDQDKAADLLAEAKELGFDGRLTYLASSAPASQDAALTVASMLEAVGFEVDVENTSSTNDLVKRTYVDHDFDITFGGIGTPESMPVLRLADALMSTSTNNPSGYQSPQMDDLLNSARAAATDDEVREQLAQIQAQLNADVPVLPLGAGGSFVAWTEDVNGIVASPDGILLFDRAWIS